jgi:16S rRNA processing protein RimM
MELREAGYFSKTHGVKGHLVLKPTADLLPDGLQVVFVDVKGDKAPYFITGLKVAAGNLIVSLENIEKVENAKALVGKKIFVETKFINVTEDEGGWLGFELIDKQHGSLGRIEEVTDNGQQELVHLKYKGKDVILPIVEEFIEQVDEEAKKIWYNAPEGLIGLYLEGQE